MKKEAPASARDGSDTADPLSGELREVDLEWCWWCVVEVLGGTALMDGGDGGVVDGDG